jgi:hypothetical protein
MPWWLWPFLIVALPVVLVGITLWLLGSALLLAGVWLTWCPRGRYALVVYSESPIWRDYFESQVLPALGGRAALLNWSERRQWKPSLAVMLFRMFAGTREFNPIAIVFEPWRWPRRFRFYRAFRSFKRGEPEEVDKLRHEFLAQLDALVPLKRA